MRVILIDSRQTSFINDLYIVNLNWYNEYYRIQVIDYRWDDEKKKKLLSWGDILVSLHSWQLQDSKNAVH